MGSPACVHRQWCDALRSGSARDRLNATGAHWPRRGAGLYPSCAVDLRPALLGFQKFLPSYPVLRHSVNQWGSASPAGRSVILFTMLEVSIAEFVELQGLSDGARRARFDLPSTCTPNHQRDGTCDAELIPARHSCRLPTRRHCTSRAAAVLSVRNRRMEPAPVKARAAVRRDIPAPRAVGPVLIRWRRSCRRDWPRPPPRTSSKLGQRRAVSPLDTDRSGS